MSDIVFASLLFGNPLIFAVYAGVIARKGGLSWNKVSEILMASILAVFWLYIGGTLFHAFVFVPVLLGASGVILSVFGKPRVAALGPLIAMALLLAAFLVHSRLLAAPGALPNDLVGFGACSAVIHACTFPCLLKWLRRRRRDMREGACEKCGYAVGLIGRHVDRCPECGHLDPRRFACASCGYTFVGLTRDARRCPECGCATPWAASTPEGAGATTVSQGKDTTPDA